jgi:hypothetical protein
MVAGGDTSMAEARLELPQAMVQRVLDGQAALRDDMTDVKERLVALARATVASRRGHANDAEHVAHVQAQMDRLAGRIARIERRLDMVE